jgi:LacI family transcriptional regulator
VCVASDAPGSQRLAAVQIHGQASGAIAAEMLANSIAAEGAVAVIAGSLATLDHAEKWKGFANALALIAPHLRLLPAIETHEQPTEAAAAAIRLACGKPGQSATLKGIYLATANSLPVLRALEERSLLPKIRVVATDLFPELESYVASGKVLATLDQRPFDQGKRAFELLMSYVLEGKQPEPETRFIPHLVLRGNLPFYVQGKIGANVCSKISVDISEATTLK